MPTANTQTTIKPVPVSKGKPYAEAAVRAATTSAVHKSDKWKGNAKVEVVPEKSADVAGQGRPALSQPPTSSTWYKGKEKRKAQPSRSLPLTRAATRVIVIHASPTKFKPGQMRRWIEEDNIGDVQIVGIRCLLPEHRRAAKLASSVVIYVYQSIMVERGLWMGRSIFRTKLYDWGRWGLGIAACSFSTCSSYMYSPVLHRFYLHFWV